MCPCWVHDLAVTRDHVVIVEPPMFISLPSLMSLAESDYVFMDWKPEMGTRVHVVPLSQGAGVSRRDLREHRGFQKGGGSAARHPSACLDFSLKPALVLYPQCITYVSLPLPHPHPCILHPFAHPLLVARSQPARSYLAPAMFSFHTANAFEEGGELHLDLSVYRDPAVMDDLLLQRLRQYPGGNVSQ